MRIVPISPAFAAGIVTWRYSPPYDCYDMTGVKPEFLLDPENGYYALLEADELIGYRLFGPDGQVPGGRYDSSALDTGGGLRPDLTGRGLGRQAVATGLAFGRERFAPGAFRVTVAGFNVRAQRVMRAAGFRYLETFAAATDGREYQILLRQERESLSRPANEPTTPVRP